MSPLIDSYDDVAQIFTSSSEAGVVGSQPQDRRT
jgi:hypothetical protein